MDSDVQLQHEAVAAVSISGPFYPNFEQSLSWLPLVIPCGGWEWGRAGGMWYIS